MSKTRIVLVRHGESNVTVNRILGGPRTCNGLSELGKLQAARLRDRLANTQELSIDVLMSSGFPRARETAEIIAPALSSLPINIDTGFGEHDPGPECDGLTFDEFVRRHGPTLLRKYPGKSVLVACHGGVVDAVLRLTMQTPATGAFEMHTKNCSITELVEVRAGHFALVRYNDHAHLHGLPLATNNS